MSVKQHEPMCFDSAQDRWWWNDHFLGDQLQDEWATAGAGGTTAVIDQQTGGIIRLTTNNIINAQRTLTWNDIRSLLVTQRVSAEFRVKISATTLIEVFIALRFDGSNQIRFEYDTNVAHTSWHIYCTDGGAATDQDSGVAIDALYHIFRIECHTHGANHVHFYIDGTETANSPITTNVPDDANDYLQPYLRVTTRENATKSIDVDYCAVRQDR